MQDPEVPGILASSGVDTISPMTEGAFREGLSSRWTPDPRLMRQAALAMFNSGLYIGFAGALLPLMATHFTLSTTMSTRWQVGLLLGGLLGAFSARWLARLPSGIRAVSGVGVGAVATALGSLAAFPGLDRLLLSAVLLGLGIGLAGVASSYALDGVLSAGRAASALDLAAACFGFGAASGCLLLIVLRQWLPFGQMAAAASLLLSVGAFVIRRRSAPPSAVAPVVLAHHWHDMVRPTRVLLSMCLMLQAALWGVAAFWLGFYANRNLGTPPAWSAGLLVLFWVGWGLGRTAAIRVSSLGFLRTATAAAVMGGLGSLFLANTLELSGAIAGSILLGAASGSLQGLVQTMANGQNIELTMVGRFFAGTIMTSLCAAAMTGFLLQLWGVRSVVWVAVFFGVLLCVCLAVLAIESRLDRSPAQV